MFRLTTGAVTNLLDRLEKWKAVTRTADPHDRRKITITLNNKALQGGENIYESIGATFDRLMQTYSTEELEFLVQYHKKSIDLTKAEIAKLAERPSFRNSSQ